MRARFFILGWAVIVWAADQGRADDPQPAPAPPPAIPHIPIARSGRAPKAGEPINDDGAYQYLQAEGKKLVDAHETIGDWHDQLGPKKCPLDLPAPTVEKLSAAELYRRAEPAVVVVGTFYLCPKCSNLHVATATGFFLTANGALATSHHVLGTYKDNGRGVVVMMRDGRLLPVKSILADDEKDDLIVLQVAGEGFTPLPLAAEDPPVGSPIFVLGHPENRFYFFSTGQVARYYAHGSPRGQITYMTITATFAKGSSGAPVFTDTGAVAGLADNTQSIYYEHTDQKNDMLQMVIYNCAPAHSLRKLVEKP